MSDKTLVSNEKLVNQKIKKQFVALRFRPMFKFLPLTIAVTLLFLLSLVILYLADEAVPGDLLYPLDLTEETLAYFLIFTPSHKIEFKVSQAEERAFELKQLWSKKEADRDKISEELAFNNFNQALLTAQSMVEDASFQVSMEKIQEWQKRLHGLRVWLEERSLVGRDNITPKLPPLPLEEKSNPSVNSSQNFKIKEYLGK